MMRADEVKQRTDLVKLIEGSGVELFGTNGTLSGICPFHEDRKPSLRVQPHKQWWWCYGCVDDGNSSGSGTGGDCFAWVMKRDSCDFRSALELLGEGNLVSPIIRKAVNKIEKTPSFIPNSIIEEYHAALMERPRGIRWLEDNRCWSRSIIRQYKIGYDIDSQRFTIPIQSPVLDQWEDCRFYDPFKKHKAKMMPYGSGIRCVPWFLTKNNDYLIIVEGEPDALAVASLGLNVATNTCGANSAEKIWRAWYGLVFAPKVVLCFDLDEAGLSGAQGLLSVFGETAIVATLPEELGEKGDSTDAIKKFGGEWYVQFMMNHIKGVGNGKR